MKKDTIDNDDYINWLANSSILLDMVKRTAIDTAEAIVKKSLDDFYSELYECLDYEECMEEKRKKSAKLKETRSLKGDFVRVK